jgi:hypothetical protein
MAAQPSRAASRHVAPESSCAGSGGQVILPDVLGGGEIELVTRYLRDSNPSYYLYTNSVYVRLRAPASGPAVQDVGFPFAAANVLECANACSAASDCNLALWLGNVEGWTQPENCLLEKIVAPCQPPKEAEPFGMELRTAFSLYKQTPGCARQLLSALSSLQLVDLLTSSITSTSLAAG